MRNFQIPKRENKTKRLLVPITPTEQQELKEFCKTQKVKLSDIVRFALKNTYNLKHF